MSKEFADELLKNMHRNLKGLYTVKPYDPSKKYSVRLYLAEILPENPQEKAHFDLEYIEDLKNRTINTIENLKKLKKMAEKNFLTQLESGKEKKFSITLELTPYKGTRWWEFVIDPHACKINVVISPYLVKYPPKIRSLFPTNELFHATAGPGLIVKRIFLQIIDATMNFYQKTIKKYNRKIKFLKQPVKSYEQLTKPACSTDKGIPRHEMYKKWESEVIHAIEKIFTIQGKNVVPGEIKIFGVLSIRKDCVQNIAEKLQGISELKNLLSYFPDIANHKAKYSSSFNTKNQFFFSQEKRLGLLARHPRNIYIHFPTTCTIIDEAGKEESVKLFHDTETLLSFTECLNHLEKFLKQRLREAQALNAKKEIAARQTRERKMIM